MSKNKNKCKICGNEIPNNKELCSMKCLNEYVDTKEFQKELDNLIDGLDKPRTQKK
jgi:predicted nucleic acid-binding Zn ribbon protein